MSFEPGAIKLRRSWAVGRTYALGDGVTYGGSTWYALRTSTGVTPGSDFSAWANPCRAGIDAGEEIGYAEFQGGLALSTPRFLFVPGLQIAVPLTDRPWALEFGGLVRLPVDSMGGFTVWDENNYYVGAVYVSADSSSGMPAGTKQTFPVNALLRMQPGRLRIFTMFLSCGYGTAEAVVRPDAPIYLSATQR